MKKLVVSILASAFLSAGLAIADDKLNIVSSSTLGADLVRQIGGEHVKVKHIASPKFNPHYYEPTPRNVRDLRKADMYVEWGLDLEMWFEPLVEATGRTEFLRGGSGNVDLSSGIELLEVPEAEEISRSHGDVHVFGNPHYHLNPNNIRVMANTVLNALIQRDASNAMNYRKNHGRFIQELENKIAEWKASCSHCVGQEVIAYHDNIRYLCEFLGIKSVYFLEPKPGIPPTAQHLQKLKSYALKNDIGAVATSSYLSMKHTEEFARQIQSKVIIIAHNVGEVKNTDNIFDFFDYNVNELSQTL